MDHIKKLMRDLAEATYIKDDPQLGYILESALGPAITAIQERHLHQSAEENKLAEKRARLLADPTISPDVILDIEELQVDMVDNQVVLDQQKGAIAEIQLLYLYKSYEMEVKSLIANAFKPGEKILRNLFMWDNQLKFFKGKGILIENIPGYRNVDELRKVVNSLKHSPYLSRDVQQIPEFNGCDRVTFDIGMRYYRKISPVINDYFTILSREVFNTCFPL
jgi:hypothetical protein